MRRFIIVNAALLSCLCLAQCSQNSLGLDERIAVVTGNDISTYPDTVTDSYCVFHFCPPMETLEPTVRTFADGGDVYVGFTYTYQFPNNLQLDSLAWTKCLYVYSRLGESFAPPIEHCSRVYTDSSCIINFGLYVPENEIATVRSALAPLVFRIKCAVKGSVNDRVSY